MSDKIETLDDLLEYAQKTKSRVSVSCDENHSHNWRCLSQNTDVDAVVIVALRDELLRLREIMCEAAETLKGGAK